MRDALFPIRVGWWHDVFSAYIANKIHLIVEGKTDVDILNAMREKLEKEGKGTLYSTILIVPGSGNKTRNLVSLLYAQDTKMILFQDGDKAGRDRANSINKDFEIPYFLTSEFTKTTDSSIEDIFPEDMYLKAIENTYPNVKIEFDEKEKEIKMITKRLEKFFKRKELDKFDKNLVTKELIKIMSNYFEIDEVFEKIFVRINEKSLEVFSTKS